MGHLKKVISIEHLPDGFGKATYDERLHNQLWNIHHLYLVSQNHTEIRFEVTQEVLELRPTVLLVYSYQKDCFALNDAR
jgi:hypothetical protein